MLIEEIKIQENPWRDYKPGASNVPWRILVVDDQTIVRVGIRRLVTQIPNVIVVGEAGDGSEALELIGKWMPDIVLMDLEMPGMSGLQATAEIVKQFPGVKVIILSSHSTEQHVLQAMRAGAKAYIPKSSDVNELNLAIRFVQKEQTYISTELSEKFFSLVRSAGKSDPVLI